MLQAYHSGKLPEPAASDLCAHLADCADCQQELGTMKDPADAMLAQFRATPPENRYSDEPQCRVKLERAMAVGSSGSGRRKESAPPQSVGATGQLGEYRLLEKLGQGGMGAVYKARHSRLDKIVAVKILPPSAAADEQAVARFAREMKAVGRLDDPNVVKASDAGEIGGVSFLVMEYVAGQNLSELGHRLGWLPVADACEVARQAALGLQAIHKLGLVHRDIKPSNLMLTRQGQVKILDLGLARVLREPTPGKEATSAGQTVGTADYMAPEQINDSHNVDIRADIYGLGCTLYKFLAGRAPFSLLANQSLLEKMTAHLRTPPPPLGPERPEVPQGLDAVVQKMLAKNPAERFSTPAEVVEAIAPFAAGSDLSALWRRSDATAVTPAAGAQLSAVTNQRGFPASLGANASIELGREIAAQAPVADRAAAAVGARRAAAASG